MPDEKGEYSDEFKQAVVETELQQKLSASQFVASVFSWGTFAGALSFFANRPSVVPNQPRASKLLRSISLGVYGVLRARRTD